MDANERRRIEHAEMIVELDTHAAAVFRAAEHLARGDEDGATQALAGCGNVVLVASRLDDLRAGMLHCPHRTCGRAIAAVDADCGRHEAGR